MTRVDEMVGKRFGKLTVAYKAEMPSKKNVKYLCRCDCGKEKVVRRDHLSKGNTKSCGCATYEMKLATLGGTNSGPGERNVSGMAASNKSRSDLAMERIKGKQFSYLTALSLDQEDSARVVFRCACGKKLSLRRSDVVQGKTKSCGCMRKAVLRETLEATGQWVDHSGEKFGKLTVASKRGNAGLYVCRCDCGSEKEVLYGNMESGDISSCGCDSVRLRKSTNLAKYGSETVAVNVSGAERDLAEWVRSLGHDVERATIPGTNLEIDVYVPSLKFGIEYNGARFHSDLYRNPWEHSAKLDAAERAGIRLVNVFDFEWAQRGRQVRSFLSSALGASRQTVGGRELCVRECERRDVVALLEETHILGAASGSHYLGCFDGSDNALAAAVLGRHHHGGDEWELTRWCVADGYSLPGALAKASNKALEVLGASRIVTWADRLWSNGSGFLAAGWRAEETLPYSFFYYDPKAKATYSKSTGERMAKEAGMEVDDWYMDRKVYRIYDCGKVRMSYGVEG